MLNKMIENYGMYGMTKQDLQCLANQHRNKKSARSKAIAQAADRIIFWKRMCGFE